MFLEDKDVSEISRILLDCLIPDILISSFLSDAPNPHLSAISQYIYSF